ncbi:uncharacterized protein VICG_00053 [Vittaforma corneae ATCC 50505]|uniref:Nucleotidyl transferase domain-containing protein n=1 Tax=Vittaforma corneae (strain ATCC 50505) TaxID=993615 RepID=L2GPC4_VITCO|nr:uncharacterized protein VICG_00053 [Vittaforma corneae ATCC 50505]ELA42738.1 hypothetical protein VICG_00053 [Vittaforma corneae ATCC 50505]
MDLSKDYLYNREKIVLLICDFYETSQIPISMLEIKDNIALFPVANIPLIEYILTNLMDQQLKNVVVAGNRIESIIDHIKTTKFFKYMNIRALKSNGNCLGDIFREIHNYEYEFLDLVIMYANHYTNVPLDKLIARHRNSKNTIMTVFTHKIDTNDIYTHIYATKDGVICYYQKVSGIKANSEDMLKILKENQSLYIHTCYSSPTIAIISNPIFSIFTDNFDYANLGDFIVGMIASGIYNYKFQMVTQDDLKKQHAANHHEPVGSGRHYKENSCMEGCLGGEGSNEDPECYYSKEIITLFDYFRINDDVLKMSSSVFRLPQTPNYVKGHVKKLHRIENSVIGEKSSVEGSLRNCIVWENCHIVNDLDDFIIITNGRMFNVFHLECEARIDSPETNSQEQFHKKETFFDDFNDYLNSLIDSSDLDELKFDDVFKQISLLRIIWNASRQEVIEAFAFFFIESIDFEDLENSVSKASWFFGILPEFVQTMDDQELLMECIHWNLHEVEFGLKTQIFFNYAFLLVEAGIIEKAVVKQFNKMHKSGTF